MSDGDKTDRTTEPLDGEFQPVIEHPAGIDTGNQLQEGLDPELSPEGTDPESNVTGRSKPASDGVAQNDRNDANSND